MCTKHTHVDTNMQKHYVHRWLSTDTLTCAHKPSCAYPKDMCSCESTCTLDTAYDSHMHPVMCEQTLKAHPVRLHVRPQCSSPHTCKMCVTNACRAHVVHISSPGRSPGHPTSPHSQPWPPQAGTRGSLGEGGPWESAQRLLASTGEGTAVSTCSGAQFCSHTLVGTHRQGACTVRPEAHLPLVPTPTTCAHVWSRRPGQE